MTAASATGSGSSRRRRRRGQPEGVTAGPAPAPPGAAPARPGAAPAKPRLPGSPLPVGAEGPETTPTTASADNSRSTPSFAHASEAEMARILDFYQVRWEYEPHTFPILWNLDGAVVESFSPDFWLPELELYLEMTTLRQKLVRKKNRKLRRVLELYPDLRVKLFYARDFRALMLKFGKLALFDELSGASGQVPHPAVGARPPAASIEDAE